MKLADAKDAAAQSRHTYTKLNWFNARWMSYVDQAKAQVEAQATISKHKAEQEARVQEEARHRAGQQRIKEENLQDFTRFLQPLPVEDKAYTCLGLVLVTTPAGA